MIAAINHQPHSPLPWAVCENHPARVLVAEAIIAMDDRSSPIARVYLPSYEVRHRDAAYIVHAANYYPELVVMLRKLLNASAAGPVACANAEAEAEALLRKLGEALYAPEPPLFNAAGEA